MRRSIVLSLLAVLAAAAPAPAQGPDDATVVAVIDSGFNPYHWDFSAAHVPAAIGDLPLDRPMSEWLEGAPETTDLPLTLDDQDPTRTTTSLNAADAALWSSFRRDRTYRFPGTKIIAARSFGTDSFYGGTSAHGFGTSSAAAGNLHGTCPECLVVLLRYGTQADGEAAINWALDQPWIDVISNSYGFSLAVRDRVYSKSDVQRQRAASERGQTTFFSAGNGQENAFLAPNTTTYSSQEGPDWIVTVSAVSPGVGNHYSNPGTGESTNAPYTGTGKPADVAGIGSQYPTGYSAATVGGTGGTGFSGTSNATPQIAGTYARALWQARRDLAGPSRRQADGVVAAGDPVACGTPRPDCELGDGVLTAAELRRRLFEGAVRPTQGLAPAGFNAGATPRNEELELASVGHGFYRGRELRRPSDVWLEEFEQRLYGPLAGREPAPARPAGEHAWMLVDSYCRQRNWGAWSDGTYLEGRDTLPGDDPAWPVRSARQRTCPGGPTPLN